MADELVQALARLVASPGDVELRRRAAEGLDRRGYLDEALAVVQALVNLTGHDDSGVLPCLCKTCIATAGRTAEASGLRFQRGFAIAGDRVLHYWLLDELVGERAEVRRSVSEAVRDKLRRSAR